MSGPAAHLIEAALTAAAGAPSAAGGRILAVGWATVDLERTIPALAADLGLSPALFGAADDSVTLGARCLVAGGVLRGGCSLAVLEPSTEGRLASILARHDEGPRVVWIEAAGMPDVAARATETAVGPARPGPFGSERLVAGGPADGPYRLLVSGSPGTIRG